VLSFAHKHWEGEIPNPGDLSDADQAVLAIVEKGFESVAELLDQVKLRGALQAVLELASEVNKYLDEAAPWSEIKTDKARAGTIIYTAMQAIDHLKVLFAPFLPHTCEQLHTYLGYTTPLFGEQFTQEVSDAQGEHVTLQYRPNGATGQWSPGKLEAGNVFLKPKPLYQKLDPGVAEEERARLG
jgi:methionyl-tRNA synthetase